MGVYECPLYLCLQRVPAAAAVRLDSRGREGGRGIGIEMGGRGGCKWVTSISLCHHHHHRHHCHHYDEGRHRPTHLPSLHTMMSPLPPVTHTHIHTPSPPIPTCVFPLPLRFPARFPRWSPVDSSLSVWCEAEPVSQSVSQ